MYNPQITVEQIKQIRIDKGLTSNELNAACGLNKNTIKSSAASKNGLSAKLLYCIAEQLDCSVDFLLGRTDDQNTSKMTVNVNGNKQNNINGNNNISVCTNNEIEHEITKLISKLSIRQRTELMMTIYKFVDEKI